MRRRRAPRARTGHVVRDRLPQRLEESSERPRGSIEGPAPDTPLPCPQRQSASGLRKRRGGGVEPEPPAESEGWIIADVGPRPLTYERVRGATEGGQRPNEEVLGGATRWPKKVGRVCEGPMATATTRW